MPDESIFGNIIAPVGVALYGTAEGGGLVLFISTLIRIATIIAGLWVLFNFIMAGYTYITSQGDSSAHTKVRDSLTMSIIGIVLIVVSYTIAGLVGLILFGDASFIISPTICGPQGC